MKRNSVAIVGASETTELGKVPTMSQVQLHADAALNAIADAGLKLADIDGIATGGHWWMFIHATSVACRSRYK